MTPHFELKEYQQEVLDHLKAYLQDVAAQGDHAACFYKKTGVVYMSAPVLKHVPSVCLRVPTGGGKTVLAAHAVPIAAQTIMRVDCPVTIWFTPSTIIRDQTLKTLRDRENPNRRALAAAFGENIRVMDTQEALHARRPDYDGGAVVIVSTIQAFRTDITEGRKVYEANGDLMDHFSSLPREALEGLEKGEGGEVIPSLANVFGLRRPLIIVDEAHNMSTQLSSETIARLRPSAIIEFTATPTKHAEQDEARGKFASNVLHHVSAASLKAADMIKMPVVLRGRADPKETISDALDQLKQLEDLAQLEERASREFIRPIMLLQSEAESKTQVTIHAERLKAMLIEDFRIAPEEVAISTGKIDELDDVDLFKRDCRIRFIITQQKLREGWDCSFAYVLCSVAPQRSERSVEQLLGRILRLPYAKRKLQEELNTAFAFATTNSFQETARLLTEGLVANGFEKAEAETLVRTPELSGIDTSTYSHEELIPVHLDAVSVKEQVERVTGGRVTVDLTSRKLVTRGAMSRQDRLHATMACPQVASAIDALHHKSWGWMRAEPAGRVAVSFVMPGLAVRSENLLERFDEGHYLDMPWALEACDARRILNEFTDLPAAMGALIDVDAQGELTYRFEDVAPAGLFARGAEWSKAALVNWLDSRIGERREITSVSSRLFIASALDHLAQARGLSMNELGRLRFRLQPMLARVISALRAERKKLAWKSCFFPESKLAFAAHADAGFFFDSSSDRDYAYDNLYVGPMQWQKHLYPKPGDLKHSGEEFDCAVYLDNHPLIRTWLRNTAKPNSFWLQRPAQRFYPDFIAMLGDGRFMAIEYKGKHLTNEETEEKALLGELWANQSDGSCLFAMVINKDHTAIDRAMRGH